MEIACATHRIRNDTRPIVECPTLLSHQPIRDRNGDRGLKPFQHAKDQGSVRPGTGQRNVEMIAPRLCPEAAVAGWSWRPVRSDPVAEHSVLTLEASIAGRIVGAMISPVAINE